MTELVASIFVELSKEGLTEGKPFEAFTHGEFKDMRGRPLNVSPSELAIIVANTRALLETTKDGEGNIQGLPIDAVGHDHGDAAGWITGVELVGDVIRLIPKWTELGIEKISKKIQRLFSVSLDVEKAAIVGGSLTNWPAVKGLKPVELQEGMWALEEFAELDEGESYSERIRRVRKAFEKTFTSGLNPEIPYAYYVDNVYADAATVEMDGGTYKVGYAVGDDGNITFNDRNEWARVRMVPREFQDSLVSKILGGLRDMLKLGGPKSEEEEMDMTKEELEALKKELREDVRTEVIAELAKPLGLKDGEGTDLMERLTQKLDFSSVSDAVDLETARGTLISQMQSLLKTEYDRIQAQAGTMLSEMMAEMRRDTEIVEFAARVTGGEMGLALPHKSERIAEFLRNLPDESRKEAIDILNTTVRSGLVDFGENGKDRDGETKKRLPDEVVASLKEGTLTLADLSNPVMAPLLPLPLDKYDLSEWETNKNTKEEGE